MESLAEFLGVRPNRNGLEEYFRGVFEGGTEEEVELVLLGVVDCLESGRLVLVRDRQLAA